MLWNYKRICITKSERAVLLTLFMFMATFLHASVHLNRMVYVLFVQVGWLMDAIKGGRPDIMKLLLLRGARVTHSHIKEVVCTHKNE